MNIKKFIAYIEVSHYKIEMSKLLHFKIIPIYYVFLFLIKFSNLIIFRFLNFIVGDVLLSCTYFEQFNAFQLLYFFLTKLLG